MIINTREDYMNQLIQRHTDLGEIGALFWSMGKIEEGNEYFTKANEVWDEFMRLYDY